MPFLLDSTWFRKGIEPGTIMTLDQPQGPSPWKILEKINEHDYQVNKEEHDDNGFYSFASTRLLCCKPNALKSSLNGNLYSSSSSKN